MPGWTCKRTTDQKLKGKILRAVSALRWNPRPQTIRWRIKSSAHILSLIPFVYLVYSIFTDNLGANPVEALTEETGIWALRFLLLTLAITPVRKLLGWTWLTQLRRMIGLYAFFYALLHFLVYIVFDQGLSLSYTYEDIVERPFITVGFAALCILLALALTSTNGWRRRLRAGWNRLHRFVYLVGVLVLLHFIWLTRADYLEPAIYTSIFIILMIPRAIGYGKKSLSLLTGQSTSSLKE